MASQLKKPRTQLALQKAAGELDALLAANLADTFAGTWIIHQPEFLVIVWLTETSPDLTAYSELTGLSEYVDVQVAERSLRTLEEDASRLIEPFGDGTRPFDLTIDVPSNSIIVETTSTSHFDALLRHLRISIPDGTVVIEVEELALPTANIYGGLALSPCTSGFSVKGSSGVKGVITAGHCSDTVSCMGASLPYEEGLLAGSHDEQWHTALGFTVRNWASDGINDTTPYYRLITGATPRSAQALNSYYCKYGKATGYDCGYLISKTRAPGYVSNANPTFMELHKDGVDLSSPGDSGGPVYSGANAIGITSGATGSGGIHNLIYTAINYVTNGLSISLVTS